MCASVSTLRCVTDQDFFFFLFVQKKVTRALLEFGSGFRLVLKEATGKGAHDTMVTGLFSLYISHGDISAATLVGQSLYDVSTLFGIPLSVEKSVQGPLAGVMTEYVDAPTKALCVFIHRVLGDCGRLLQARNCEDFYSLIARELRPSPTNPIEASRLIDMMCGVFPSMNDVGTYEGRNDCWERACVGMVDQLSSQMQETPCSF